MTLIRSPKASQPNIGSQSVRYLNELRALDALFREGSLSRAGLARVLGLNRSTTGSIIANLLADALVVEQAGLPPSAPTPRNEPVRNEPVRSGPARNGPARSGRPGIEIALNPAGGFFIGAAVEADRVTALVIDLSGRVVRKTAAPFRTARHPPEKAAEAVARLINSLLSANVDARRVHGVCVAVPAMFRDGVVLQATLLGWRNVDLRPLVAAQLSAELPVTAENDANAFAIAETYAGAAAPAATVAFLLVDSGAGGGIVVGGRLLRGGFGIAGEFGHLHVGGADVGGAAVSEGRGEPGTLEAHIGRDAVLARYEAHGGRTGARLADLLAAVEAGEPAALRTADEWGRWLARGLLGIVNVLNPSLIIIGGPVGALFRAVSADVERHLLGALPPGFPAPQLAISRFGPEGPAFGAALLLHQRAFSIDERALYPDSGGRSLFSATGG